jgi:hypothetical protein
MCPGPVRALLACPPLPAIGLISYGLYLWHWPVDVVLSPDRTGLSGGALFVARTLVALAIATASYRLVERPIRTQQWRWTRGRGAWIPLTAAATVAVILLTTVDTPAVSTTLRTSDLERFAQAMTRPPEPGVTKVLVEGDSVAASLAYPEFEADWSEEIWMRGSPRIGCGLFGGTPLSDDVAGDPQDRCRRWPALFTQDVDAYHPDLAVLLLGGWEVFDRDIDGRRLRVGTAEMETALRTELDRARRVLTAGGARLVILTTPCFSPTRSELGQWGEPERADPARVAWLNSVWLRFAADHPDVSVLDLDAEVCPNGAYAATLDGVRMRTDGTHFTERGARRVWQWLAPSLRLVAAAAPG